MSDQIDGFMDDLAGAKAVDLEWIKRLQRNKDGDALATVANLMLILAHDVQARGMLAYNAFTAEPLIMRPPPSDEGEPPLPGPYPRQWNASDVVLVCAYIQRVHLPRVSLQHVEAAMLAEATLRQYHPVTDWLDDLRWDGVPRIDNWLLNAFDCDPTPFHRAAGAKLLIAAVRRVKRPGCKFDQMLVLEGAQGIGKSRSLRVLFGDGWFSDAIPSDLNSKDAAMALLGVWCLEFAEIEHLIRAEVETIKAFLSRPVDRYRPPYGKSYVERPRQGVLIGTTNADDYLRDASGNRRIWPVRCRSADPDWIHVHRDQLWAEAVVREAAGETIWLDEDSLRDEAKAAQAERMTADPWADAVLALARERMSLTVTEVLTDALFVPKERWNSGTSRRIGAILRAAGWERRKVRDGRRTIWTWYPMTEDAS